MCPIIASDKKHEFRPAPEGLHPAVCVDVVDLGVRPTTFGPAHKIELRWQIDQVNPDNEKRFLVIQRYTLSLHEKSTLRRHLEAWRGKPFSKPEAKGYDLEKLIGFGCQLQVVHRTITDGTVFANVQTIVPLGKGMPRLAPLDYIRVTNRAENGSSTPGAAASEAVEEEEEEADDDDDLFPA